MIRELRDSGVAWLGSVPADWETVPARALFGERKAKSADSDVHLTPSQKYGVLPQEEYMKITGNKVVLNLTGADNMRHVEAGDYVSHLRSFQGGLEYAGIPGKVSAAYTVLKPKVALDSRFFRYLFKSDLYVQALQTTTDQLRDGQSIRYPQFSQIPLPQPSLDEQRVIADYLDRETAQIDAFIAKNEELIVLLTERRAAVTAQAVTRGIDGSVALKDSGWGWLGRIPEDWEVVRVKFAARSLPGYAFASGDFVDDFAATRLLRGINVGIGTVSWAETVGVRNPPADVGDRYRLDEGDLVLGMDRPVISGGLRLAPIAHVDAGALLVQRVLRLRGTRVRNDYLEYSLAWGGFAMYIEPDFTGVSVPHMSEQQVGNFAIALPDTPTQRRIVSHIREQHASIDAALETARQSISLMRERRAALISAAVTGKIDVGVTV